MGKDADEFWAVIGGLVLAATGVGLVAGIIDALTKPRCGACRREVARSQPYCPHCGHFLGWRGP